MAVLRLVPNYEDMDVYYKLSGSLRFNILPGMQSEVPRYIGSVQITKEVSLIIGKDNLSLKNRVI